MASETPNLQAITERLERLERQNRRLKRGGIAVLAAFGAVLLMGQAAPVPKVIEAQAFILKDSAGRVRARLFTLPEAPGVPGGGPTLRLYDSQGHRRTQLSSGLLGFSSGQVPVINDPSNPSAGMHWASADSVVLSNAGLDVTSGEYHRAGPPVRSIVDLDWGAGGDQQPSLDLYGPHEGGSVLLGTSSGPEISLYANGKFRVDLSMGSSGDAPGLRLDEDASGKPTASITSSSLGPILMLENGGNTSMLSALRDRLGLDLMNNGKERVQIQVYNGDPSLLVSSADGFSTDIGSTELATPTTGETLHTSAASIVMFGAGKHHKVIWQAPGNP